jgi:NAD-dependent dihydropyrimidine dehydrogenase PreA subunit
MERLKYLKNVVTLELDAAKCAGCGICEMVCPHGVFKVVDGKAVITDRDLCMECGACARNCPAGAVEVKAGVGCAAALLMGALRHTEPICGPACDPEGNQGPEAPQAPCC